MRHRECTRAPLHQIVFGVSLASHNAATDFCGLLRLRLHRRSQVSFGEISGRVRLHDLRGVTKGTSGLAAYCDRRARRSPRGGGGGDSRGLVGDGGAKPGRRHHPRQGRNLLAGAFQNHPPTHAAVGALQRPVRAHPLHGQVHCTCSQQPHSLHSSPCFPFPRGPPHTRPLAHSPTRPLAHSPTRPLAHSPTRPLAHSPTRPPPSKLLAYVWLSELQARLRRAGARVDCFATQPGCVGGQVNQQRGP
jgi:hypothetical protein